MVWTCGLLIPDIFPTCTTDGAQPGPLTGSTWTTDGPNLTRDMAHGPWNKDMDHEPWSRDMDHGALREQGHGSWMRPNGPGRNSWARTAQGPIYGARTTECAIYEPERPRRVLFMARTAQGPIYGPEQPRVQFMSPKWPWVQFMGPKGPGTNFFPNGPGPNL